MAVYCDVIVDREGRETWPFVSAVLSDENRDDHAALIYIDKDDVRSEVTVSKERSRTIRDWTG